MRSTSSPLAVSMTIGTLSPARAQAAADREPVLAGQHEVEHDEMRRVALELLVELARVGERCDLESLLGKIAGQEVAQANVVVDDEYLGRGRFGRHGRE